MRCRRAVFHIALAVLGAPVAAAQASPLAGPQVEPTTPSDSLVQAGYDGRLILPERPPAIAALDLLDLSEKESGRVEELLDERAALMDILALDNVVLLSELEPVFQGGTVSEKIDIMMRSAEALKPAVAWGKLRERIAGVLPEAAVDRYERLISEYEGARYRDQRNAGEVDAAWQYRIARHFEDLGWELERAAERVLVDNGQDTFAMIIETLNLTPEQEGAIRKKGEAFYFKHKGRPSKEAEAAFFMEMLAELDVKQRIGLVLMAIRGDLEDDPMLMD